MHFIFILYYRINTKSNELETQGKEFFEDVCLINCFRAHGIKAAYERDGPMSALQDGNSVLRPFQCLRLNGEAFTEKRKHLLGKLRKSLVWIRDGIISAEGKYIIAAMNHFIAIRLIGQEYSVNLTHRRHAWRPALLAPDLKARFSHSNIAHIT